MKKSAKKSKKIQGQNDFKRMINFISDKFDAVDKRFDGAVKHFKILDERFDNTDERFDNLEKMFRELQDTVDSYAKRADTYFQEMVMLSHQINRHEKWIRQIAEKIGIKLHS